MQKKTYFGLLVVILLSLMMVACGGAPTAGEAAQPEQPTVAPEALDDEGQVLPTPLPTIEIGDVSVSAAKATPEDTWVSYLPDSIAEQVKTRRQIIDLYERYENPDVTAQRLESLVTNITLVEDRTVWNTNTSAGQSNAFVEYDVQITYANGDTETLTCQYNVAQEFDQGDGVWYVVNPGELQVFANCT